MNDGFAASEFSALACVLEDAGPVERVHETMVAASALIKLLPRREDRRKALDFLLARHREELQ
jgi:hypothetical protein